MSNTYISGILLGFKTCSSTCVCSVMSDSEIPQSVACQVPLSIEYSRQESWRGLPFPTPRVLPDSRIKPSSLASPELVGGFFITPPPGKPSTYQLGGCSVLRRSRKTGCCWNEHLAGVVEAQALPRAELLLEDASVPVSPRLAPSHHLCPWLSPLLPLSWFRVSFLLSPGLLQWPPQILSWPKKFM